MNFKRILFAAVALMGAATMMLLSGCNVPVNAKQGAVAQPNAPEPWNARSYESGVDGDYFWSLWISNTQPRDVRYQNGGNGNYSVTWGQTHNFTCGKGWSKGKEDLTVTYTGTFTPRSNGYLALYGWTYEPAANDHKTDQVEYYVVESFGSWNPGSNGQKKGTVYTDGDTYDIYYHRQIDQPSLDGNQDFDQFFSVRRNKRTGGTITFKNHVDAWKRCGLNMSSTWDYVIMETEGYESSGESNITILSPPGTDGSVGVIVGPGMPQTPSGYPETRVAFRSRYNNKYLCADLNVSSNAPLYADRSAIGAWERFYMVHLGGDKVALRSEATGKYVCAEAGGAKQAVANRSEINLWEIFDLDEISYITNGVMLKNNVNGTYCDGRYAGWYLRFDGLMQQYQGRGCIFYLEKP